MYKKRHKEVKLHCRLKPVIENNCISIQVHPNPPPKTSFFPLLDKEKEKIKWKRKIGK